MRLDALLGDGLGNTLAMAAFELTGKKVAQPALNKRHDTTQEKQPHAPARAPKAHSWALANRTSVEPDTR